MLNTMIYRNPAYSVSERVDDLMSRMTLDEKLAQLGSCWVYQLLAGTTFSVDKAQALLQHGIGHITRVGGASNLLPADSATLANTIQNYLVENTRLGIPAVIHEECCSGYMARGATIFPQAIGIASTWEPDLIEAMSDVIRTQMRSVGAHHALSPVLDIARDARWGRVEETFGEDPYLVARLGVAYIKGLQGDDLKEGIAATGKHFVGYGNSEGGMNWAPSHIGWRELHEVYLLPFEAAVVEAKLASIMNAYHELDGVPCGLSKELLTEILRETWGFDGTVVSDYFTINMLTEYHHVAVDKAQAATLALEAGLNVELPATDCYGDPLREALQEGKVSEALIDASLRRVLEQKFALGIFEQPYVDTSAIAFDMPEHGQLAEQVAQKSMVLLKNHGDLLPLSKQIKSLAVIGPNADNIRNLFGDYAYPAHMESLRELATDNNVFNMPLPDVVMEVESFTAAPSILQAIRAKLGPDVKISYAKGCDVMDRSTADFAEAVEAARQSDIAILVVGDKAGLTDDCTSGESRDRADLDLPGVQPELVKAIYETGTPIVLVLINGRPVTLGWIADDVPAILEAWFPAEGGAKAVADILFGDANPGGKLPISFPRSVGQVPVYYGHRPSGGRSHWKGDYVDISTKPHFPFGHGLSYTHFEYSNLRVEPAAVTPGQHVDIQVDIRNAGQRAGDEVVQLYTHQEVPYLTRPVKELKGFQRVTLEPGQTKVVTFRLAVNQLGFYDEHKTYAIQPGTVEVMIGSSAEDIECVSAFEIEGEKISLDGQKVFFSDSWAE